MSKPSYAGRHRPAHKRLRRPAVLRNGFVLPASAAAALVITATGASVAESQGRTPAEAGAAVMGLATSSSISFGATSSAQTASDVTSVEERRSQANARSAALLARQQQADRAARAKERVAVAKKQAAAKKAAERKASSAHRWVPAISGGSFTSGFKMRWGRMHEGDDFSTPVGTPIKAMSTGKVIYTGWYGGGGNTTKIEYWDGTVSVFMHQSRITATVGQQVAPGDLVGYSGNTGHSTGPHLHLEIHPNGGDAVDPSPWLVAHGLFTNQLG